MTLGNRVGLFLVLLGVGLIGLFVLSDIAQAPECGLLFAGIIVLGVGIVLMIYYPNPAPPPSGRFGSLKRKKKKEKKIEKAIEETQE